MIPDLPGPSHVGISMRDVAARGEIWRVLTRAGIILLIYTSAVSLVLYPRLQMLSIAAWPFCGFLLYGFLNAAHDCVHCTQVRSKASNRVMGALWCTPILVNFSIYRYQHLAHHRHTGVKGDTEPHKSYTSIKQYIADLAGFSLWRGTFVSFVRIWRGCYLKSIDNAQRRSEVRKDNWGIGCWLAGMVILTLFFPRYVLCGYWLPLLFYAPSAFLFSLPEHYGLAGIPDVAHNTRTVRSIGIVRFFLWNGNYHAEHHAYPYIPASRLQAFHNAGVGQDWGPEEKSYLGFHVKLVRFLLNDVTRAECKT